MNLSPLKVLILEDNQYDAELNLIALQNGGNWDIASQVVADTDSFRRALNEFAPDIILSDYSLPTCNGLDALKITTELKALTPFIIVTGALDEETAVECIKQGAWDYVLKDHLGRLNSSVKWAMQHKEEKMHLREAEQKLVDSEKRLLMALDASKDGLWDWNTETGKVYYSDGYFSMLGYSPGDFDHDFTLLFKLVHPDDEEILERHLIYSLKYREGNMEMEIRLRKKDGNYAHILSRGKVFEWKKNGSPLRIVGTNVDITQRKKQEDTKSVLFEIANSVISTRNLYELFESIQKSLHRVVDTKNCYVALYDKKTDTISLPFHQDEKDTFTEFPAGKSLTGYVIKTGKSQLVDAERIAELEKDGTIEPLGSDSSSWLGVPLRIADKIIGVYVIQNYDGSVNYTSEDVSIMEFVSDQIALAIERKIDQDNILFNQERQRRIFESLPDGLVVIDIEGKISDLNTSFCNLVLMDPSKIKEINFFDFIIGIDNNGIRKILEETQKSGYQKNIEFVMKNSVGKDFFAETSFGLIHSGDGRDESFVIIVKNINERKAYESNLKIAKEKAEESDRLKSAFLSNMSHEIRTPMNAIIGFAELLSVKNLTNSEKEEFIQQINFGADTLMRLIDDIIDISKIEAGQLKMNYSNFSMNIIFDEISSMFSKMLKRMEKENIQLIEDHNGLDSSLQLHADEFRLKQILMNLISNAIKFTDVGEVRYGLKKIVNDKLEFYVKDSGIGIEKEKQKIIFDRFRQAHETHSRFYGGTGLGLAISKNLVEMMGGTILVKSEYGKGSEFTVTLPYKDIVEKVKIEETSNEMPSHDFSGKTILIVEDEESNFQFLNEVLKKTGARLLHAIDGMETIQIFRDDPTIDLILMDIQIPSINGYEVTREIKKINSKIPVIAQTAYAMAGEREKSVDAGCDDYLAKPIKIHELMIVLKKYLYK